MMSLYHTEFQNNPLGGLQLVSESDLQAARPMKPADITTVVDIHMQAFQNFFLTFLGPRFLRELYSSIRADPSGIAYVYNNGNGILGFVAGTDQPDGFYRRLLVHRWWRFGLASIGPVLSKPSILPRLLRAFNKPGEVKAEQNTGTLMSIATLPNAQNKGIGQILVKAFLNEASRRDLKYVNLTTDQDNNQKANIFYQKLGFTCARSFTTPEGRRMNEYIIQIDRGYKA